MFLHYASFFYMIRDFENSQRLTKGEFIKVNLDEYEKIVHDNTTYLLKDGFGMAESIFKHLSGDSQELPVFKSYSDNELNIMADGTIFRKDGFSKLFMSGLKDLF